jgi:hypothetical protein
MDVYREVDTAQTDFFAFLDGELKKIETFYQDRENEATQRLTVLRDQLHILRDRRLDELVRANGRSSGMAGHLSQAEGVIIESEEGHVSKQSGLLGAVNHAFDSAVHGRVGRRTKFMQTMTTPHALRGQDDNRDYVRRVAETRIPYRSAKRKLKLALQEFYRGLELLKSYALLNRTAFRKITKKYDKLLNSRPAGRYMSEKVNKAWFVKSDVLDGHIQAVEDLYARYFEAGNHKIAANKLRSKSNHKDYHGGAMFRNGLLLAGGVVLGIQGVVKAGLLLFHGSPEVALQTSYLLQIYAGYLLILLLSHFFCLACEFWTRSKVNYFFIFEFDTRHHLDWRQLFEVRIHILLDSRSSNSFVATLSPHFSLWVFRMAKLLTIRDKRHVPVLSSHPDRGQRHDFVLSISHSLSKNEELVLVHYCMFLFLMMNQADSQ